MLFSLYNNILPHLRLRIIITSVIFISFLVSLSQGSSPAHLSDLFLHTSGDVEFEIIRLRLIRTVAAFTTGGLLSLAGSIMQVLLQNPLADPYILGLSGGAATGTLLLMLLGLSGSWLLMGAWAGSLFSVAFIFLLARLHRFEVHALIIMSICLGGFYSATITSILLLAPNRQLHSMLFWLTGDLNNSSITIYHAAIFAISIISCFLIAPGLSLLARGSEEAALAGLATTPFKAILFALSSLFTACAVTTAGCIGFIGLLVPHITRKLVGFQQRRVLLCNVLLGGSLLTIADTVARTIVAPMQLPVGILLTIIGAPTLIWLLRR